MGIFWPHTVGDLCTAAPPRFFETFSYLPPLTDGEIAKQVDYLIRKGFTPCVEFEDKETAYAARTSGMDSSASAGYYDNRYWSMWKLPMFGATDADSVLKEIKTCAVKFPNSFVRLSGFDANRQARARPPAARCALDSWMWGPHLTCAACPNRLQVQVTSMLVARPKGSESLAVADRRVAGQ